MDGEKLVNTWLVLMAIIGFLGGLSVMFVDDFIVLSFLSIPILLILFYALKSKQKMESFSKKIKEIDVS